MTDFKPIEPVVNDDKPMWLVGIEKKRPDTEETVIVFNIKRQGLYECLKCGAVRQSFEGNPDYCLPKEKGGCGRKSAFRELTGTINPDLWKLPQWQDVPKEELDMREIFWDAVELIKMLIVFNKEIEYKIYTLWIFSTWKLEAWDAVGFPVFIGMPDSGKSRALRIIYYLAYRATKTSGVTHAVIPRLCHFHNVTLLIDEAHTKLNPRTESGSKTLDFIKDSYKKGAVYHTCDLNNQSNVMTYRNFGFKALAGEKSFNPALLTRSLIFWMAKEEPDISKLSYVEDKLNRIRTYLLNYRLKTDNPPDPGNDFVLTGRNREIFESIISTGRHIGVDVDDVIEYAQERKEEEEEALKDTVEYEILTEIKKAQDRVTQRTIDNNRAFTDRVFTDAILEEIGWVTGEDAKEDRKARQRLGYILKDLGLNTKRTSDGRALFFDKNKDRLDALYRRFNLT